MGHQPDRYFEAVKHDGQPGYWRTSPDAPKGSQVKHLWPDGKWHPSFMFATDASLVESLAKSSVWREITAAEVPTLSEEDRREIAAEVHQERTEDARSRYEENPQ